MDKDVLQAMLTILPEEFHDIYDDIPGAKEMRMKMEKKVSSVPNYPCAMPMIEDIRQLDYKSQAKVCKAFHQHLQKQPYVYTFFTDRFEETYSRINMRKLDESVEWIGYAVNDLDNAITDIDYNSPMTFFEIAKKLAKVIAKEKKSTNTDIK